MSRPYAEVIGDPISQSKSPAIHNFWLRKLGINAEYRAVHVRTGDLQDYFRTRFLDNGWRGCNVTMPHKQTVMSLLGHVTPEAARIGAVNTIIIRNTFLTGYNTDGLGFMEPIWSLLKGKTHRQAHLIGSGGAAKAIADALRNAQFTIISYTRDIAKARHEIGRYVDEDLFLPLGQLKGTRPEAALAADPGRLVLTVNASALGMNGNPPLLAHLPVLIGDEVVYDIVTHPLDTALLQQARAKGLRTIDGLTMLIGQAAAAFEKFFDAPAPREHDAELRALLTA